MKRSQYSQFPTRIAKSFADIARGDLVRQTDFCVAFFEVLTEKERNDEADVAFAKFVCALERARYVLSPVEKKLWAAAASSLIVFMARRLQEDDWRVESALLQAFDACSNNLGHCPWRMCTLRCYESPVRVLKVPVPRHEVVAACIRLLAKVRNTTGLSICSETVLLTQIWIFRLFCQDAVPILPHSHLPRQ